MNELALFATVTGLLVLVPFVWRLGSARAERVNQTELVLQFHRGIDRKDVEAFLGALTGLRPPWWHRWFDTPSVVLELTSSATGVEHRIVVSTRHRRRVEAALRADLPSLRIESSPLSALAVMSGGEYRLTNSRRQLRVDSVAIVHELLSAIATPRRDEAVTLQWTVTPPAPPSVPRLRKQSASRAFIWPSASSFQSAEDVAAAREKLRYPILAGVLRIGVSASTAQRQRALLRDVEAALHPTAAPGVHLRRRLLPTCLVTRRLRTRAVPTTAWPITVNAHELAVLIGWPFGSSSFPGLSLSGCRPLALAAAIPERGTVIGDGTTDGRQRPAALDLQARVRHLFVVGATGTGKSTLMQQMVLSDINTGRGALVIDPKGADLIDGVLERLDARHHDRVVVLDVADVDLPIGLNPLRPAGVDPELAVEQVVGSIHRLWSASWGVRSDDIWRAGLRSLVVDPDATLADLSALLTDPAFRRPIIARTTDPFVQQFWRQFEALSDAEAAQWVAPVLNKHRALFARPGLRRVFGQPRPTIDVGRHLDRGGVVMVPLNAGVIGEDAAALFAAVLLAQVWNVIQQRAGRDNADRHPLMLHLDEVARYATLPVPFEELLSQARSYRVGVTMATQHLHQLSPELRHTVLSNPRSRISFQVGASDARVLAAEFGLDLTADDLQGLDAYQVVAQLHASGRTQPAATLTTRPPSHPITSARLVREQSRNQWGVDGASVDAAIAARMTSPAPSDAIKASPAGRKRRQP